MKINPLVLIGIPTLEKRPISWEWSDCIDSLSFPLGAASSRLRIHDKEIAQARNEIVESALSMEADYVLMISDDVIPPHAVFQMLWQHKTALVTGVYWTKGWPQLPYIWNKGLKGPYTDWKYGEYFPVDLAGCDCLLVHTDVFRAMEPPWFSRNWTYEDSQHFTANSVPPYFTEDFFFFTKARKAGFQLYCDTLVQCGHQDRESGVIFGLDPEMPQMTDLPYVVPTDDALLIADLGAGFHSPWWGPNVEITRFDGDASTKPDIRCDLRSIPEPDEKYDIVHARHTLEHFSYEEARPILREWLRILKVGGKMEVSVPNLAFAAREILKADEDPNYSPGVYPLYQIYGRQLGNAGELHRNGFTLKSLESILQMEGLENVEVRVDGEYGENLRGTANKMKSSRPISLLPIWREIEVSEDGQSLVETAVEVEHAEIK